MGCYYVGTILFWSSQRIPNYFQLCDGRSLPINDYAALYSLIGKTFGGDATSFKLPDLRSRVPLGADAAHTLGACSDATSAALSANGAGAAHLTVDNLAVHTHETSFVGSANEAVSFAVPATARAADSVAPGPDKVLAASPSASLYYLGAGPVSLKPFDVAVPTQPGSVLVYESGTGDVDAPVVVAALNGEVSVMQNTFALNYIICCDGLYPPRGESHST